MSSYTSQQTAIYGISSYVRGHEASIGLLLAGYGTIYLASVLLSGWIIADWGKDITSYPPSSIPTLMPRSLIEPLFFLTSFPALVIGAAMLSIYSTRGISPEAPKEKQYVAIVLTAFGFAYQVIGAWPLGNEADFPWQWQKQIVSDGAAFSWTLYILSLIVLTVGAVSLYKHSQIYHKKHAYEDEAKW